MTYFDRYDVDENRYSGRTKLRYCFPDPIDTITTSTSTATNDNDDSFDQTSSILSSLILLLKTSLHTTRESYTLTKFKASIDNDDATSSTNTVASTVVEDTTTNIDFNDLFVLLKNSKTKEQSHIIDSLIR